MAMMNTMTTTPMLQRIGRAIAATVLLAITIIAMTACTPWATYPPIEGAANVGSPAAEPMPRLMAEAIMHTQERFLPEQAPIIYNLPQGATTKLYADAARWMPSARPMEQGDENTAIHVTEVRLRVMDAQVDVIYPRTAGHHEFVTLYFKKDLVQGWRVTDSRLWRIRQGAPEPTYGEALAMDEAERMKDQPAMEETQSGDDATVSAPTQISEQP